MKTIILLSGMESQQLALIRLLNEHNPALSIRCALTLEDLYVMLTGRRAR